MAITHIPALYHSDRTSQTYFKNWGSHLKRTDTEDLRKSPLHNSLSRQESSSSTKGYSAHSYGEINPYKVCEIAITSFNSGATLSESSKAWGNWRSAGIINVYDQVLLWPQEKVWNISFSNSFESAYAKLDQQGLLSKVSQLNQGLRSMAMLAGGNASKGLAAMGTSGGRFMSKYKEAPAWSGTKPLALNSSLTFQFRFGQAGIFSGEHEVVRPILALALPWAPYSAGTDTPNYMKGPAPTAPTFLANLFKEGAGLINEVVAAVQKGKDASGTAEDTNGDGKVGGVEKLAQGLGDAVSALTAVEDSIMSRMNKVIETTLNSESTFLNVRIGRMVLPPLVVKDISWNFDMTHTDEYGFPTAGAITLGSLEAIQTTSQSMVAGIYPTLPVQPNSSAKNLSEEAKDSDDQTAVQQRTVNIVGAKPDEN